MALLPAIATLTHMQKWEYKVVKRSDVSEEQLNGFGAEGWELMNFVLPHANIPGSFDMM